MKFASDNQDHRWKYCGYFLWSRQNCFLPTNCLGNVNLCVLISFVLYMVFMKKYWVQYSYKFSVHLTVGIYIWYYGLKNILQIYWILLIVLQDFVIVLGNNPNDAEKMLNAMFQASSMNSASKSIEKKDSKCTKKMIILGFHITWTMHV